MTAHDIYQWSPRQESNLYLTLRRHPFYPLNYEERPGPIVGEGAAVVWLGLLLNM